MSRRLVSCTFLLGLLVTVALPLVLHVKASSPPSRVPIVVGSWDGVFHDPDDTGVLGQVRSVIGQQDGRRIRGDAEWLTLDGLRVFNAYNFSATIARQDFITGTGLTPTGRVVFQERLAIFEGAGGDAAVLVPDLITPVRGRASRVGSLLLRPFPAHNPPEMAGQWDGKLQSASPSGVHGDMVLAIAPVDEPGASLPGEMCLLTPGGPILFYLRATASDDNRLIMIAQGTPGRFVAEGMVTPASDGRVATVNALYRYSVNDGRFDFGAINFRLASVPID